MAYLGIRTHYLAPTNTLGARIVSTISTGKRYVMPYDYSLSPRDNHIKAAGKAGPAEDFHTVEWSDHYSHMVEI